MITARLLTPEIQAPGLQDFDYFRQTRSRKVYSPWAGTPIVASPSFDLESALSISLAKSTDAFWKPSSPLADSPLTSPAPSEPGSPHPSRAPSPVSAQAASRSAPSVDVQTLNKGSGASKSHHKRQSRENRRKKREQAKVDSGHNFYQSRPAVREKYFNKYGRRGIEVDFDLMNAPAAASGFTGVRQAFSKKAYTLEEIVRKTNFRVTPTPVVDAKGRIVAHLGGHPDAEDWPQAHQAAAQLLEENRMLLAFPRKSKHHRRGNFFAVPFGVSHGGGRKRPTVRRQTPEATSVLARLNASTPFKRIAHFASSVFATWAPRLYDYYVDRLGATFEHGKDLKRIFVGSIFPSATYNFGPSTACFLHTDAANLPFGWCSITALGRFDSKKGGHIVLWDLGVIIEFPPGSTIFIPSAVVAHANTKIGNGETRYSFTQYAAGGLFRWAEHRFMNNNDFFANLTKEEAQEEAEREQKRWSGGIDLFSTLADISTKPVT
ncbi:hypothetical protein E4T56_gene7277 [Termitomyces sp. T112]|nr:hypothetical protein E4T56_gene7277 [Termitomyces sp. T112]KAH0588292.1 hypothetical protein H2248_006997 [Termitomyces sp. 'cryptogamus']